MRQGPFNYWYRSGDTLIHPNLDGEGMVFPPLHGRVVLDLGAMPSHLLNPRPVCYDVRLPGDPSYYHRLAYNPGAARWLGLRLIEAATMAEVHHIEGVNSVLRTS